MYLQAASQAFDVVDSEKPRHGMEGHRANTKHKFSSLNPEGPNDPNEAMFNASGPKAGFIYILGSSG